MEELKNIKTYYLKSKEIDDNNKYVFNEFVKFASSILEPEDYKYIVIDSENHDGSGYGFMFLLFEETKSKQVINFFDKLGVLDQYKDVTNDIHTSKIFDNKDFNSVYSSKEFKHIFDEFIYKNLSVDDILDKINERGINSLTKIDKEILKKA